MNTTDLASKPAFGLLRELRESKQAIDQNGQTVPFEDCFDEGSGTLLYETIRAHRPKVLVELGFAHGSSTLYMLQALADNGEGKLITFDFIQTTHYRGVGLKNVERAGLGQYHQFVESRSEMALASLVQQNFRCDWLWIDTSHQFDQTMVEVYFGDKILVPNGIMAFHDYDLYSVRAACNFLETNLNYRLHPSHSEVCRILIKYAEDNRVWHHFVPFEVPKGNQSLRFL